MSDPLPTRRERLRNATVAEIKSHARRLLVTGGPPAISLRAIARDMGMTAPAIYRYFPSLDALVADLCEELFDELSVVVGAARSADAPPVAALLEMSRGFRRWCIDHPAEFALMFGNPIPGVAQYEIPHPAEHAGALFGASFLSAIDGLWRTTGFATPPAELLDARLEPHLAPYRAVFGDDVPVQVIYVYLSGWIRLYGLVAMEVFGHLHWAVTDVEPLFELELATFAAQLTTGR